MPDQCTRRRICIVKEWGQVMNAGEMADVRDTIAELHAREIFATYKVAGFGQCPRCDDPNVIHYTRQGSTVCAGCHWQELRNNERTHVNAELLNGRNQ